jgi:hypothetical protein
MKTPNNDRNLINIAFDKTNGLYIAYSLLTGIFTTGVCVESACEAYREKFYEQSYESMHSETHHISNDPVGAEY